jgi:membrane protein DedA with SNARE-associated domain
MNVTAAALPSFGAFAGQYGYLGIGVLVGAEGFGLPLPGETAIIAGAATAASGHLNIWLVAAVAFAAAVTGDSIGYLIGRTGGHRLVLRYGKYVRLTPGRLERVERFMTRQGPKVVVIARFVEGLRQFNGIVAGATGMRWRRFVLFNAIGAALWVGVWASAAYAAGDHLKAIEATIGRYQWYAIAVAVLAAGGYAAWRAARHRDRRGSSGPGESPAAGERTDPA